jgi:hypothetical protein
MRKYAIVIVSLCLVGSVGAFAQEPLDSRRAAGDSLFNTYRNVSLGHKDLTWSGALCLTAPVGGADGDTTFVFHGSLGYFVTDQVEVEVAGVWSDTGNSGGARIYLGANRYFGEWASDMYPYIGGGLSTGFAGQAEEGTALYAKMGVRHYFSAHMGLRYWIELESDFDTLIDGEATITGYVGIFAHAY